MVLFKISRYEKNDMSDIIAPKVLGKVVAKLLQSTPVL